MTTISLVSPATVATSTGAVVTVQFTVNDDTVPVLRDSAGYLVNARLDELSVWTATFVTVRPGQVLLTITAADAAPVVVTLNVTADGPPPPGGYGDGLLSQAFGARDDAIAAAEVAEAARDAAIDISGIAVPDDVVEALVTGTGGAGPLTRAALSATSGPIVSRAQEVAGTPVRLLRVTPTDSAAPFEIHYNSYPNADGTKNHGTFLGYNPGNHSDHADFDPTKPSAQIGIEQDYLDGLGGRRGPEFYFEVRSPDGYWNLFRTVYTRPEYDNTDPEVIHGITHIDVGNGSDGHFTVLSDLMHQSPADAKLFEITKQSVQAFKQLNLLDNLVLSKPSNAQVVFASDAGSTTVTLDSPGPSQIIYKVAGVAAWGLAATDLDTLELNDKAARTHVRYTYGANSATASTRFLSTVIHEGLTVMGERPQWAEPALVQLTVGAAGAAAALPATPTKYLRVMDDAGATLVIPAYAA